MPSFAQVSEAAVAVSYALDSSEVEYGFFGGFAVAALGRRRDHDHFDRAVCAVGCTKAYLLTHLKNFSRFILTNDDEGRPDIATYAFKPDMVMIDFYPISMASLSTQRIHIECPFNGERSTRILSVVFIYKGILQEAFYQAAAADHEGLEDLKFLGAKEPLLLRTQNFHFNRLYVGRIMAKRPEMQIAFKALRLDPLACRKKWKKTPGARELLVLPEEHRVQNGLLFHTRER